MLKIGIVPNLHSVTFRQKQYVQLSLQAVYRPQTEQGMSAEFKGDLLYQEHIIANFSLQYDYSSYKPEKPQTNRRCPFSRYMSVLLNTTAVNC